jgi:hypothetical protein
VSRRTSLTGPWLALAEACGGVQSGGPVSAVKVTRRHRTAPPSTFEVNDLDELCAVIKQDGLTPRATLYMVATPEDAKRLGGIQGGRWSRGPWLCGWPEARAVLWVDDEATS